MTQTNVELPVIEPGTRPQVLLVGNGFNYAGGGKKWADLVKQIAEKNGVNYDEALFKKLPKTMRVVVAANGDVKGSLETVAESVLNTKLSGVARRLYAKLVDLPVDQILTTNYSYEIEEALCTGFKHTKHRFDCYTGEKKDSNETQLLHRFNKIKYGNRWKHIWHIHGLAGKKSTIVIGHPLYGKLTAYVINRVTAMVRPLKSALKRKVVFNPESWVDYFMVGDVYIMGFAMDSAETDLWWLLSSKHGIFPDSRVYFFDRYTKDEVALLLDAYGVIREDIVSKSVEEYYTKATARVKELAEQNGAQALSVQ